MNSHPEFEFDGFSKDMCRSMIAMLDVDRSGKLGAEEFKILWLDIQTWKVSGQKTNKQTNKTNRFNSEFVDLAVVDNNVLMCRTRTSYTIVTKAAA